MRGLLKRLGQSLSAFIIPAIAVAALVAVLIEWGPREPTEQVSEETWTCSMHPQVRLPQPGACPICGMDLIPLSQLTNEQARTAQQAGLDVDAVEPRELFKEIRTVGKIDYDERRVALITARIAGRVDRVYADFTGIKIKKNDHLVDIYSPELYSAQSELVRAAQALEKATGNRQYANATLESARAKLRLLGILPEQIAELEKGRKELTHLTIYAPIGGVVIEKDIREQQYVKEGDALYRIADLDPVWLYLDIYEYDLAWIRYGQPVDVTVEAYPGEVFKGTIVFIEPFLDDKTRTVKVRVNLKNTDLRLKPAMYGSATIHVKLRSDGTPAPTGLEGKFVCPMHPDVISDKAGKCSICGMPLEQVPDLFPPRMIPTATAATDSKTNAKGTLAVRKSAVLDTGRRQVAYRKKDDGTYELVDLKLGPLAQAKEKDGAVGWFYPVLAGLKAGDKVVVQGGFLLDSQRQIEGMPSLLYTEGRSAASLHAGHGGAAATKAPAKSMPVEHKH